MAKRGMVQGKNAALTKAAVERHALLKKLKESDREDLAVLDEARVKLSQLLRDDMEFWYDQAKDVAMNGEKGCEGRGRVIIGMLGKIVADRKDREMASSGSRQPFVFQVIGDVKRGTIEAVDSLRRGAIEVET
jgi:hypothetical protein